MTNFPATTIFVNLFKYFSRLKINELLISLILKQFKNV